MKARHTFRAYIGSAADLFYTAQRISSTLILGAEYLAKGSRNWLISGAGRCVGYKGPLIVNGVTGGKVMMPAAESYASLGTATTAGIGSIFRVLTALFFIGAGLVKHAGTSTNAVATSTLSFRFLQNGVYSGTTYQAGLAQSSAPTVFTRIAGPGFSGTKLIQGTRAAVIWRIRSGSGAVSVASLPSNVVVTTTGQTFVITFPLVDNNGQDRWGIGVPKAGFGEFGPFYELQEIAESAIAAVSRTDGAITAAAQTLTSVASAFVAGDVGKNITVKGAGTHLTITAATNANPVVLASVAHGLASGATVIISGATGNWTPINGTKTATVTGVDTFTIPVDSTTFGALTGTVIFNPQDLNTTIASLNSATSVQLTLTAGTTVSGATFSYGGVVDGVPRSVEFEWTDGALAGQPLAPIDDFPPPPAKWGGTLNDTGFLDGAYGDVGNVAPATQGATIVTSLPLKFESWPPDNILYAPQIATALSSRAADGYAYRAGISTLGALVYTGGSPAISFQLRWPNTGCVSPHNMVIAAAGRLYMWTSQHGLARIGADDEPEVDWAIPFAEDVAGFVDANVVMGWDAESWNVCTMHGKMILPYNAANDRCGSPLDLTGKIRGNIISAVTDQTKLLICCSNVRTLTDVTTANADKHISSPTAAFTSDDVGQVIELTQTVGGSATLVSIIDTVTDATHAILHDNVPWNSTATSIASIDTTLRLYHFNAGTGMISEAYTPWIPSEDESDNIFQVLGAVTIDDKTKPVTVKIFTNGDRTNAQDSRDVYLPRAGFQHVFTERPNVINAKSHSLYLKYPGSGGDVVLDSLQSSGEEDGIVISG